jgi:hypothetical protein
VPPDDRPALTGRPASSAPSPVLSTGAAGGARRDRMFRTLAAETPALPAA